MKIEENLFKYFTKAGQLIKYSPHDIIYMQEDHASMIYLVTKGRVRVYQVLSNGQEITYEVLEKGRIFGESSFIQGSSRPTTVEAVNHVELICCSLEDLYPYLMESKELTISILQLMNQTNDYLVNLIKKAYTYNRYEKVASFLLEQTIVENIDKGIISNTIPYSHEEIANTIGLARVTVTNILNEFQKQGYIENKYRKVKIIDRLGLESVIKK